MAISVKAYYRDYAWAAIVVIFIIILSLTVHEADTARRDYQQDYQLKLEACERSKEEYAEAQIEKLSKWQRTDTIGESSGDDLSLLRSPRGFIQGSKIQVVLSFGKSPDGFDTFLAFTKKPPERAESSPNTIRVHMKAWPYPRRRPIDVEFISQQREPRVYLLSNDSRRTLADWIVHEFSPKSYNTMILLEFKNWLRNDSDGPVFVEFPLGNAKVELTKMVNRYR